MIIIGDSAVGKTNLLSRWLTNTFQYNVPSTVHIEFATKTFRVQGKLVKVQFWDTGAVFFFLYPGFHHSRGDFYCTCNRVFSSSSCEFMAHVSHIHTFDFFFFSHGSDLVAAGQERYRALTRQYYKGAHGVVVMYSVTDYNSFNSLGTWLEELRWINPESSILIVGNKTDLESQRRGIYGDLRWRKRKRFNNSVTREWWRKWLTSFFSVYKPR